MKDKKGERLILENHLYLVIFTIFTKVVSLITPTNVSFFAGIISIIAGSCAIIFYIHKLYQFIRSFFKK